MNFVFFFKKSLDMLYSLRKHYNQWDNEHAHHTKVN